MPPTNGAVARTLTFWRRLLTGTPAGTRIALYEELAPTLAAGIGVREALHASAGRHFGTKRRAAEILDEGLARDVALSDTMRAHPLTWTPLEAAFVATGERTGRLDVAFRTAAAQLDRARSTRNRIVNAVAYPTLLVHCLILIPALGMIAASQGFGAYLRFVVPALLLLWGAFFAIVSLYVAFSGNRGFAAVLVRVPVIGRVLRAAAVARFARAFGALHGAGVTHDEAMRIAAEASGSVLVARDAEMAIETLRRGDTFRDALDGMTSIPDEDRGMLLAGEQSGELEESARRVADLEDERFDVATKRAISLLPPILVGIVGIAVAVVAFNVIGGYYKSVSDMMR